jgi:hypothetical protein
LRGHPLVMLMALEAAPAAELTSDQPSSDWVQSYGRHNKDCLEWNDTCVNCVRAQSGGDYSCSNIGIACQPKEVGCVRRAIAGGKIYAKKPLSALRKEDQLSSVSKDLAS